MRSLKSLLGSALLQDKTVVHNSAISYQDIIALFLQMLAQQARSALGGLPERVVLGRPVHFVDDNSERDQQAQEARDGISGVSLDEEASALVRFQQAYQANAKVMQVAMALFDSILQVR